MPLSYPNILTNREVLRDTHTGWGTSKSYEKTKRSLTEGTGDSRKRILHTTLHNLERGTTNYAYSQHYSDRR
jgi:hypothetical protein